MTIACRSLIRTCITALALAASPVLAAPCESGITFGAGFAELYTCSSLGTPPDARGPLGGLTFLDRDTILIGGSANGGAGVIYAIDVTRDAGGHITAYSTPATLFAFAPNIDGGLSFGPAGVLFATTFSDNMLLQYRPGSTAPDRAIDLTPVGIAASTGTLAFVPTGFGGAGHFKIASYSTGMFYDVPLIADGATGLFNLGPATPTASGLSGPEGIVYIDAANPGFAADSLLLTEYLGGRVGAFQIDAEGDPIVGSRTDFLTGLSGAEGAVIDPSTGDFLFSTFGGSNQILVISGFVAPPSAVPEPATWAMMVAGIAIAAGALRRRPERPRLRDA